MKDVNVYICSIDDNGNEIISSKPKLRPLVEIYPKSLISIKGKKYDDRIVIPKNQYIIGVTYQGSVRPIHEIESPEYGKISCFYHDEESFDRSTCRLVSKETEKFLSSTKKDFKLDFPSWYIEISGNKNYICFNGIIDESDVYFTFIQRHLEIDGFTFSGGGRSIRPAKNGIFYDWYLTYSDGLKTINELMDLDLKWEIITNNKNSNKFMQLVNDLSKSQNLPKDFKSLDLKIISSEEEFYLEFMDLVVSGKLYLFPKESYEDNKINIEDFLLSNDDDKKLFNFDIEQKEINMKDIHVETTQARTKNFEETSLLTIEETRNNDIENILEEKSIDTQIIKESWGKKFISIFFNKNKENTFIYEKEKYLNQIDNLNNQIELLNTSIKESESEYKTLSEENDINIKLVSELKTNIAEKDNQIIEYLAIQESSDKECTLADHKNLLQKYALLEQTKKDIEETALKDLEKVEDLESELKQHKELVKEFNNRNPNLGKDYDSLDIALSFFAQKLNLLRDSVQTLNELDSKTEVIEILHALQNDETLNTKFKKVQSIARWMEAYYRNGRENTGRIYYRISDKNIDVLISKKSRQDMDMNFLRRRTSS